MHQRKKHKTPLNNSVTAMYKVMAKKAYRFVEWNYKAIALQNEGCLPIRALVSCCNDYIVLFTATELFSSNRGARGKTNSLLLC